MSNNNTGWTLLFIGLECLSNYLWYRTGKAVAYQEIEDQKQKEEIQNMKRRFEQMSQRGY